MNLGVFSLSLAVKDLKASHEFYEKLGFKKLDGDDVKWLILENGDTKIGLFQGMFEQNVLAFNPADVRNVQKQLKQSGITFVLEADESTVGPAHAMLLDPDGNPILMDQF
ncbi:MAG: VOC family protein [Anaerolineae bacterium]|nr:VOC family protein [Anaerolineae bacterium]